MIAVDLDKVLLEVCKGCNEEFSEEPCEPGFCMIRSAIEDVPTLTLDDLRPKGRWVLGTVEPGCFTPGGNRPWCCSECGNVESWSLDAPRTNFCHECGADMRGYMSDGQRNQEG